MIKLSSYGTGEIRFTALISASIKLLVVCCSLVGVVVIHEKSLEVLDFQPKLLAYSAILAMMQVMICLTHVDIFNSYLGIFSVYEPNETMIHFNH